MKNLLKGIGATIGYLAVYFLITFFVIFTGSIIYGIKAGIEAVNIDQPIEYISLKVEEYINENMLLLMVISAVLSLLVYWLILIIGKKPVKERLDLSPVSFRSLWPILPLGIVLNIFISYFINFLPIPEQVLQDYAQSSNLLDGNITFIMFLSVAVMAPVLEEVLYRGLIMKTLQRGMPAVAALIIQAVIFGLMHGQILWICYATVLGIVFGFLKLRYKSLYPGILLHFSFNASNFILTPLNNIIGYSIVLVVLFFAVSFALSLLLFRTIYIRTGILSVPPADDLTGSGLSQSEHDSHTDL